jgi:hypothetical protein
MEMFGVRLSRIVMETVTVWIEPPPDKEANLQRSERRSGIQSNDAAAQRLGFAP